MTLTDQDHAECAAADSKLVAALDRHTTTAHIQVAGVALDVDYTPITDKYVVLSRVTPEGALDCIYRLLAPDVINSIRVACVKHAREEMAFLKRCEDQERLEA